MVRTYQDCLEWGQNSVDETGKPELASGRIRLEKTIVSNSSGRVENSASYPSKIEWAIDRKYYDVVEERNQDEFAEKANLYPPFPSQRGKGMLSLNRKPIQGRGLIMIIRTLFEPGNYNQPSISLHVSVKMADEQFHV